MRLIPSNRSLISMICFTAVQSLSFISFADKGGEKLMEREREKPVELRVGTAFGGALFLSESIGGLVNESTADWTGIAYARIGLTRISPRLLEVYTVFARGYGLNIRNDDFQIGPVRLHLFDLGFFWNSHKPVTVSRVPRSVDLTLGLGAELEATKSLSLTLDWRTFMPLDVFDVLTKNGDYSRLVGEEILKGGQLWLGASYRF